MAKRFHEQSSSEPTVVESAMELSEKYAALSNEAAELKQENKELADENRQLNDKLAAANTELRQTQKELTEANELLVEMRIELNNWKSNVLGFRKEMREADIEELKALFKILTILGGEVETDLNKSSATGQSPSLVGGTGKSERTDSTLQVNRND
jgi:predicted nuclease with TOPRIM domain